jgi:hypothetical protein
MKTKIQFFGSSDKYFQLRKSPPIKKNDGKSAPPKLDRSASNRNKVTRMVIVYFG